MIDFIKQSLWKQFGGSIDMLHNAIAAWPVEFWQVEKRFFYIAYHTLVFLDYYLTIPPKTFSTRLPYTLKEPADIPAESVDDVVPDSFYTKQQLLDYLQFCREKCRNTIASLTEEKLAEPWIDHTQPMYLDLSGRDALKYSVLEILLYNMRHVQHHSAQLNLLLRQKVNKVPDFVSAADDNL